MGIAVLGPLGVDGDTSLSPRDRVVLAALAVRAGDPVDVDTLTDALWGDDPPASSGKIVQGCVVRLRRTLGTDAIETVQHGYRLTLRGDEIDARRFERMAARGEELLALDEPERAAHTLAEALALWRGPAFGDLDGWDPGRIEAQRLAELRRDAQELHVDAMLRAGRHREVLAEAQRLVKQAPLREERWALLARAQYQAGRQADALRTLQRARTLLANELGLDPGHDLVELEGAILRQDDTLDTPAPPPETHATCPYLGLVAYDVDDADAFFGREGDVQACLDRLTSTGVLAVVGPSGSGKSSLVRAGVAARLRRAGRRVVVVTPGAHPMDALTALPGSGPVPALVVDQFEEAVALCDDVDERARLFAALAGHAEQAPLVLAVRADRLGDVSAEPAVARLVEQGLYLLAAMDADDLRAAITEPARQAGLLLEPGLVDLLVREVEGEPGALPLLSHALRTTWERREGRTLTVADYTEGGGIRGAVAQSAEDLYAQVPAEQRPQLRDLLLRLVSPTPEGAPVRSPLPRRLVTGDETHERLIERLAAARLVTSDDDTVELAHEALTRAWPRLRSWLDENVEGQRILHHLSAAADTWEQMARPDSELYRGVRLAQALGWRDATGPHLTPTEAAFLDAGAALEDAERQAAEERARQQARTNRRLRMLLAGVGVLALVAIVAGVLATRQAARADAEARAAEARRVGAQALVTEDVDRSLLLAVEATRIDDSSDTQANLFATLARTPQLIGSIRAEGAGVLGALSVSPDGRTVAVFDDADRYLFFDVASGRQVGEFDPSPFDVRTVQMTGRAAFHPDGDRVAVTVGTGVGAPVRLLDTATWREVPGQFGGQPDLAVPWDVAYSRDGSRLAVAFDRFRGGTFGLRGDASIVVVWDTAAPDTPLRVIDVPRFTHGLAFGPDGSRLYTGTHDAPPVFDTPAAVRVYDVATGAEVATFDIPSYPLALSPDGTLLATASAPPQHADRNAGTDVVISDARTGAEIRRLNGHTEQVHALEFSADGSLLTSTSADRTAIVWHVATGERSERLHGHVSTVAGVAFGPDDATLYTSGADRAILVWDLRGDRRFVRRRAADPAYAVRDQEIGQLEGFVAMAPTAEAAAYWWPDLTDEGGFVSNLQIVDTATGAATDVIDAGHGVIGNIGWHPEGDRFATAGLDGHVRVWDRRSGTALADAPVGDGGFIGGVAYIDDGARIVVHGSGIVHVVDAETLEPVVAPNPVAFDANWMYASPDDRTVLVMAHDPSAETGPDETLNAFGGDDYVLLVDVTTGDVLHERAIGFDSEWASFSPDGARVALTGRGGQVLVLDVGSGEPVRQATVGHDGDVVSIDYAPDGDTIVSGGLDGTVSLWDGRTGELRSTVRVGRPNSGVFARFRPDGHTVVIATWDGVVHTLDTRPTRWVDFACDVAGRDLTPDEWRDAFGDRLHRRTCPLG